MFTPRYPMWKGNEKKRKNTMKYRWGCAGFSYFFWSIRLNSKFRFGVTYKCVGRRIHTAHKLFKGIPILCYGWHTAYVSVFYSIYHRKSFRSFTWFNFSNSLHQWQFEANERNLLCFRLKSLWKQREMWTPKHRNTETRKIYTKKSYFLYGISFLRYITYRSIQG